MTNSIVVSSLTPYVDEINGTLFIKKFLTGDSVRYFNLREMVHYEQAIHILTPTQTWGSDTCNMDGNTTNSIAFSENKLRVDPITFSYEVCSSQLDNYWAGMLKNTSWNDAPLETKSEFSDWFWGTQSGLFAQNLEKAIWQGSKLSGSTATLTKFDGLYSHLYGATYYKYTDTTVTSASTAADYNTVINGMITTFIANCPEYFNAASNLVLCMSIEAFYKICSYFVTSYPGQMGWLQMSQNNIDSLEFKHPIYNVITIKAVSGLQGLYKFCLTPKDNIYIGTLKSDEQYARNEYNSWHDKIKMMIKCRFGTAWGRTELVVTNFTQSTPTPE